MSDAIREALQTLRENIRQEGRTVQQIGIRDNDDTRNAIAVLLDNEDTLQSQTAYSVPENEAKARALEWAANRIGQMTVAVDCASFAEGCVDRLREEAARLRTAGDEGEE